jgi:hypothetical protein
LNPQHLISKHTFKGINISTHPFINDGRHSIQQIDVPIITPHRWSNARWGDGLVVDVECGGCEIGGPWQHGDMEVGGFETWSLKHAHVWGKPAHAFETYTNQPNECATFGTCSNNVEDYITIKLLQL